MNDKIRKWIKTIPQEIIDEIWDLSQLHEYRFEEKYNDEDEFWRCVSNAFREQNNPKEKDERFIITLKNYGRGSLSTFYSIKEFNYLFNKLKKDNKHK